MTAVGEAGHASMPSWAATRCRCWPSCCAGSATGCRSPRCRRSPGAIFTALLGETRSPTRTPTGRLIAAAAPLHPVLDHVVPALTGTTMAPTMLEAGLAGAT